MTSPRSIAKSAILSLTALFLTGLAPALMATVAADDCVAPANDQPGVHQPVGSDAGAFIYQCDGPYAGQWKSQYYVFNDATGGRDAIYSPDYSYDCTSGKWTKAEYDYSAADSQYHYSRVATAAPAGVATNCPVAAPAVSGGSGAGTSSTTGNNSSTGGGVNASGPNSNTNVSTDANGNTNLTNITNASMVNTISGVATTGNSLVLNNTLAGGAQTGDAYNQANIVNMLQSSSNALGSSGNTVVFTTNIDGDVNGDLFLDPNQLSRVQNAGPNSNVNDANNLNNNLNINNSTSANIDNNVDLASKSGDATVSNNTTGGDATTGSAKAVANIINTINSSLVAGHSFIGTININGNLNGDILLPDNFVDSLIAANTPTVTITAPSSNTNVNDAANSNTNVKNSNNLGITNNVNSTANTGSATVTNNTGAGNATSGNATTNITAFNLTGSKVIGKNSILVFVNAPGGKWVGVIVNAPQGSTAAALGGDVTSTGPSSNTNSSNTTNDNANLTNTTNGHINNNINTSANSGNATEDSNTHGGNATSGDADSRVNLSNVEDSTLDLSGWLGILFINVFGTWNGSFGVNTSAGDPIAAASGGIGSGGSGVNNAGQVFRFVARANAPTTSNHTTSASAGGGQTSGNTGNSNAASPVAAVLAAQAVKESAAASPQLQTAHSSFTGTAAIIAGVVVAYIIGDALYTNRRTRAHKVRT